VSLINLEPCVKETLFGRDFIVVIFRGKTFCSNKKLCSAGFPSEESGWKFTKLLRQIRKIFCNFVPENLEIILA